MTRKEEIGGSNQSEYLLEVGGCVQACLFVLPTAVVMAFPIFVWMYNNPDKYDSITNTYAPSWYMDLLHFIAQKIGELIY